MNNFDIIFLSYKEPNAKKNLELLKNRGLEITNITGINGLYNAVIKAAETVNSEYFYLIDADSIVLESFKFNYNPYINNRNTYIWLAKNIVNGLVYGNGGIKLHHTQEIYNFLSMHKHKKINKKSNSLLNLIKGDMPVTPDYLFIKEIASITEINTTPFEAWKSGFREGCKLSALSKYYTNKSNRLKENSERLEIWCNSGLDAKNGKWAIEGALSGKIFGEDNHNNLDKLLLINDYEWLELFFNNKYNTYVFP